MFGDLSEGDDEGFGVDAVAYALHGCQVLDEEPLPNPLLREEREQEQICCSERSPAPPSLAGNRSLGEEVGGLGQSYPMDFGVQAWWVRHRGVLGQLAITTSGT